MAISALTTQSFPFSKTHPCMESNSDGESQALSGKWVRMLILKIDVLGRPIYTPDPESNHLLDKGRFYVVNRETGDMYLDEPKVNVLIKCIGLVTLGIPLYTAGKMIWSAVKTVVDIAAIVQRTFIQMYKHLENSEYAVARQTLTDGFIYELPHSIGVNIWNVVRVPFLGIALEAAALYGIYDPYEGRDWEAHIERIWQDQVSYKSDFRFVHSPEESTCLETFIQDVKASKAFYLAHCFQVRGNIRDKAYKIIQTEPVELY